MDKYEYQVRSEEIRTLIARGEYAEAAEIADMIDWRRVKSVMMLCTISDLYKINRRFEESKELLLLAYDRHPGGRTIVYSLCELSIKMGEVVQAIEYYKEFVQIAPKDTGRYILQYKLYVAQEVSLEERIEVLEELKKRDYREKWAYELAYLYHRVGLATRCVEECDDLILWFGEGRYVTKAMELKMLHQPLAPDQQARYEGRYEAYLQEQEAQQESYEQQEDYTLADEEDPMDIMNAPTVEIPGDSLEDIQVKTMDVGEYNTINLQKELADSMKDLWEAPADEQPVSSEAEELYSNEPEETEYAEETAMDMEEEPVCEPEEEISNTQKITQSIVAPLLQNTDDITEMAVQLEEDSVSEEEELEAAPPVNNEAEDEPVEADTPTPILKRKQSYEKVLGMEYDGQMSLIIPDFEKVEKQITGQLKIEDVLAEWERMKEENEKQCAEEVRQLVLQHTGKILVDFDQAVRDGLLEKLESSEDVSDGLSDGTMDEMEPEESENESEEIFSEEEVLEDEAVEEDGIDEEFPQEELEEEPEKVTASEPEKNQNNAAAPSVRALTKEEKELYAAFIQSRKAKEELIAAIDAISLAAYTGNVIITGEEGMDTLTLAKNMMKEVQMADSNFSGKIAKISGSSMNQRDIGKLIGKLANGALIIENAGKMTAETGQKLYKALQQENTGIIVIMEGSRKSIGRLLEQVPVLKDCFNACVNIEALDNDSLVAFGKRYAKDREYSIDEMGLLALHTRISDHQTSDHAVTLLEVKEMVDDAISHANRKSLGHFFDILFAKRYDEEDMIILRENDFI